MNDLTFATTLISFFATLVTAVVIETTSVPARAPVATAQASVHRSDVAARRAPKSEPGTQLALAAAVAR